MKIFKKILLYPFKKFKKAIDKRKISKFLSNVTINKIDGINGYDFELLISVILENCKFKCNLTPKSKDNGADILAYKNNLTWAIQTKLYYNHSVGNKGVQEVYTAKNYFNANLGAIITNSTFSKQAIDVAKKLNIILIDRTLLTKIISNNAKQNEYLLDSLAYEYLKEQI